VHSYCKGIKSILRNSNSISNSDIFGISSEEEFNSLAIRVFNHQYQELEIYRTYCDLIGIKPMEVKHYREIPFLPIQFFKSKDIICRGLSVEKVFKSSGTTKSGRSSHLVSDLKVYEDSFIKGFSHFFGDIQNYCVIALLPSYQEQGESSLVYMTDKLIELSTATESDFYLNNKNVFNILEKLKNKNQKTILLGVSYALLDLIAEFDIEFPELMVMETGGMKGRRAELTKAELHAELCAGFGVKKVFSEYGMTELLSQAYSLGDGVYQTPPWMKIILRSTNDPLQINHKDNKTGGINIIDLANINSCSFIATQDLGRINDKGFQIMGRFDHSDTRGCNLLIQ
jgi:phenylacetate-coenzyme A ligase PaaK-like adenylate-forming protein